MSLDTSLTPARPQDITLTIRLEGAHDIFRFAADFAVRAVAGRGGRRNGDRGRRDGCRNRDEWRGNGDRATIAHVGSSFQSLKPVPRADWQV